jgi:hypothetical protein
LASAWNHRSMKRKWIFSSCIFYSRILNLMLPTVSGILEQTMFRWITADQFLVQLKWSFPQFSETTSFSNQMSQVLFMSTMLIKHPVLFSVEIWECIYSTEGPTKDTMLLQSISPMKSHYLLLHSWAGHLTQHCILSSMHPGL